VMLSDGQRFTQAMLASQNNHFAIDGYLTKNCIIKATRFSRSKVQDKTIIIILAMDVVKQEKERLGMPQSILDEGPTFAQPATPTSTKTSTINKISAGAATKSFTKASGLKGEPTITPINQLSPYRNQWTVKARITKKSDVRKWSNERGSGYLFNCTMTDETGSIKATAFMEQCDRLLKEIEEGKVYYISKGKILPAKKIYNTTGCDYEITFNESTNVELCNDDSNMPGGFSYTVLANLGDLSKDDTCNAIGVVRSRWRTWNNHEENSAPHAHIIIVDHSGFSCKVTLWGKVAEDFDVKDQPVIALRHVKVGDYHGRDLNFQGDSSMTLNPDLKEAHFLRGWYDANGLTYKFQPCQGASGSGESGLVNHSQLMTLEEVKSKNIGIKTTSYFTVKLRVKATPRIKEENRHMPISYPACRSEDCVKGLSYDDSDRKWHCAKCSGCFDAPEYRYLMRISLGDHMGSAWFNIYDNVGKLLFEKKAEVLEQMKVWLGIS
ncbi:replication factor-a protein, partial [Dacryopinax primogenitus]